MWETAKLTERVDGLAKSIDGLGPTWEKALDKHGVDIKERFAELKSDMKQTSDKVSNLKESIDSFKGAMKVVGGLYALVLIVIGAFLAWYLRPIPTPPVAEPPAPPPHQDVAPEQNTAPAVAPSKG